MDRRKLLKGTGAAALATTLAAAAGSRTPDAMAATTDAGPTTTVDHARRVLGLVDVDLGLVDPTGIDSQIEQRFAAYQASAPRDPKANDLYAWTQRRMVDLCGTADFAAVPDIPQARTLLAFSFLAYSQHPTVVLPQITRSMTVPSVLATLEPDFLPVLLDQVTTSSKGSPAFTSALQASSAEVDRLMAAMRGDRSVNAEPTHPTDADIVSFLAFTVVFVIVWVTHK
jgi:hypothetical protein